MRFVALAVSLWGHLPQYTAGALRLAEAVPQLGQKSGVSLQLWVYHDASVPAIVRKQLQNNGAVMYYQTGPDFTQERRAMWRFQALGQATAICTMDADLDVDLYFRPCFLNLLRQLVAPTTAPCCITWRPAWKHMNKRCVPAGCTGFVLDKPFSDIAQHMRTFLSERSPLSAKGGVLSKAHRYPNGYGLDEWYITFTLLPLLNLPVRYYSWVNLPPQHSRRKNRML